MANDKREQAWDNWKPEFDISANQGAAKCGFYAGYAAGLAEGIPQGTLDGYDAALAAASSEWEAIETVEDLPKESGHYIWQTKDGEVGCGAFHPKLHVDEIMRNCVAYMPLPQPYQRPSREGE